MAEVDPTEFGELKATVKILAEAIVENTRASKDMAVAMGKLATDTRNFEQRRSEDNHRMDRLEKLISDTRDRAINNTFMTGIGAKMAWLVLTAALAGASGMFIATGDTQGHQISKNK